MRAFFEQPLQTIIDYLRSYVRRAIPSSMVTIEVLGFAVLGFGLFLAFAILSFYPQDVQILLSKSSQSSAQLKNLGGPVGAWLAYKLISTLGVIAAVWPMVFTAVGALMVFGLLDFWPTRRLSGLVILSFLGAAFVHIHMPKLGLRVPMFGFGGNAGQLLGSFFMRHLGVTGATLYLSLLAVVSLIITGQISVLETAQNTRRRFRTFWIFAKNQLGLWSASVELLSDDELIKQALREEIKARVMSLPSKKEKLASITAADHRPKSTLSQLENEALAEVSAEAEQNLAEAVDADKIDFYYRGKTHGKPSPELFTRSEKAKDRSAEFKKMAQKLMMQLSQFKVEGKVSKIVEGPVVTTYEFEPVPGTKVAKITGLAPDLARMLQANSLRILAPIPGKKVIGFEVPNAERRTIGFADLVGDRELRSQKIALPVAMGVDAFGDVVIEDLAKMPHLLVAGSTGSGKSVFMNTLIGGLIARHTAKDLRFVMVDPKMVELAAYNALPHMACPVITDPAGEARSKLNALVLEMEDRFNKMRIVGARNLQGFNDIVKREKASKFPEFKGDWIPMPYIVLIIDELADMMMVLGKDAEIPITRLAQKARAAGIHLVIATQRPSADVVTGLIKANFPTRVAFRVLSGLDSRTILDTNGAESLIGQGDMLYLNAAGLRRMHGAYLSDSEVQKMVKASISRG